MEIAISGRPRHKLYVLVLRNCDSDWRTPEIAPHGACDPWVLRRPWAIELDDRGHWNKRWSMTEVPKERYGEPLWLRVSLNEDGRGPHDEDMFTVVSDSCSVWNTLVGLFSDSKCQTDVQSTLRGPIGEGDDPPIRGPIGEGAEGPLVARPGPVSYRSGHSLA